jgi:hypothetical protein
MSRAPYYVRVSSSKLIDGSIMTASSKLYKHCFPLALPSTFSHPRAIKTYQHALWQLFHQKAENTVACLSLGKLESHETKKDLENRRMEDHDDMFVFCVTRTAKYEKCHMASLRGSCSSFLPKPTERRYMQVRGKLRRKNWMCPKN